MCKNIDFFNEGTNYYTNKNYKKALEAYEKALSMDLNQPSSLYNCAVCHIKLRNYQDAIRYLKKAAILKNDSKYFFNIGYCYAMLNVSSKALYYFNLSWCLNSGDSDCEKAIKLILENRKSS